MARARSAGDMITDVRIACHIEGEVNAYPNSVILELLNQAGADLYDQLVAVRGADFYEKTTTISVVANTASYNVPNDFYQVLSLEIPLNSSHTIQLRRMSREERPLLESTGPYTAFSAGVPYAYMLHGANAVNGVGQTIELQPTPHSAANAVLYYVPAPERMANENSTWDGIAGWERYMVDWTCIKIGERERDPELVSMKRASLNEMKDRIKTLAIGRDALEPARVRDVTLTGESSGWRGRRFARF